MVRPHEGTLAEPKGDRLNLLWALQANTSPILALFADQKKRVSPLLVTQERDKPVISFNTVNGERHNIWPITETQAVTQICDSLAHQPVYIADGHHRYESALAYQRERCACSSSVSGDEGFNFVMMMLVDFSDPGLVILPPHRLVRGISKSTLDGLLTKLKSFFAIEEVPLDVPDVWQRVDNLFTGETSEVRLVLFGLSREHLFLLRLPDFTATSQMMPYFHSELYKRLDVSIVDHIILEELVGLSRDREETSLAYSYDRLEAVNRVIDEEYQLALLLRPVRAEMIKAIADAGDRMPRKSTYFCPKLPSGLIFHRLV